MKWHHVEMGKVANVVSGFGFPREFQGLTDEEFPFFKVGDMNLPGNEKCMTTIANTISGATLKKLKAKAFPKGTIIFPKIGAAIATNKKRVLTQPSVVDNNVMGLIPKSQINSWYLYYWMLQFDLRSVSNIGPVPSMRKTEVERVSIPLPPPSEQRRIVEILDQADALRKKRADADAKAARILPALFYRVFGDPLALISSGEGVPLSELEVDLQNGFACGEKDVEDGVPHLRMNNIDDAGVLNLELVRTVPFDRDTERYRLMEKDVLFMGTNSEDKIGKTCLFLPPDERTYLFSNHLIRLRVSDSRITPEYLAGFLHLLWSKRFFPSIAKRWVNQSAVAQSSLAALRIPLPGERSLQMFTTAFQNLLSLRAQRVRSGETLDQTFAVLLHRAFTGDLTVKWRETHMKELLAEMEAQAKALDCPSTQSKSPEVGSKRHAGHDMYNKAALAAYITDRCHTPDRPMGRVKLAKLFYLVQQKAEIELTETFMKRAAGPLDDEIHKFLSLAQKSKWLVLLRGEGDLKPVKPGTNVSKAIEQAEKLLGPAKATVDEMLDQMKGWGYRALERWATVLDASFELKAAGHPATVETIKDVIQKHPEWVPKLNRDEFSDTHIETALKGLCGFGFITNQD
jgi:type I restriction enzyme S subunit